MHDDLNDDLSDLLGRPAEPRPMTRAAPADFKPVMERFEEPCKKCGGSGNWRPGYACFACKGTGKLQFKTSPQKRAAVAAGRKAAAEAKAVDQQAWREAHKPELEWLSRVANREETRMGTPPFKYWSFPVELRNSLGKYGTLTDGQIGAIRKCMAKDEERKAQRATEATERAAAAPEVSIAKIEDALTTAHANGKKRPFLLLDAFTFSRAPDSGKNPGAIYVKTGDDYLGKVVGGRFVRSFACDDATADRVVEVASDPEAAAVAFGKETGRCSCCGAELTNLESIERGIGPICAGKYGW